MHAAGTKRLMREFAQFSRDEQPAAAAGEGASAAAGPERGVQGIYIAVDEADITRVQALVIGPDDTPYEGGFFHFDIRFPDQYPTVPPKVQVMTTEGGTVRFNPNLYADGKVCLSILGTWFGPGWSPNLTLRTVLLSVQSLMNNCPYDNEPGWDARSDKKAADRYNVWIRYQTLRVAVYGMATNPTWKHMPHCAQFDDIVRQRLVSKAERYRELAAALLKLNGKGMGAYDPYRFVGALTPSQAFEVTNLQAELNVVLSAAEKGEPFPGVNALRKMPARYALPDALRMLGAWLRLTFWLIGVAILFPRFWGMAPTATPMQSYLPAGILPAATLASMDSFLGEWYYTAQQWTWTTVATMVCAPAVVQRVYDFLSNLFAPGDAAGVPPPAGAGAAAAAGSAQGSAPDKRPSSVSSSAAAAGAAGAAGAAAGPAAAS